MLLNWDAALHTVVAGLSGGWSRYPALCDYGMAYVGQWLLLRLFQQPLPSRLHDAPSAAVLPASSIPGLRFAFA